MINSYNLIKNIIKAVQNIYVANLNLDMEEKPLHLLLSLSLSAREEKNVKKSLISVKKFSLFDIVIDYLKKNKSTKTCNLSQSLDR